MERKLLPSAEIPGTICTWIEKVFSAKAQELSEPHENEFILKVLCTDLTLA